MWSYIQTQKCGWIFTVNTWHVFESSYLVEQSKVVQVQKWYFCCSTLRYCLDLGNFMLVKKTLSYVHAYKIMTVLWSNLFMYIVCPGYPYIAHTYRGVWGVSIPCAYVPFATSSMDEPTMTFFYFNECGNRKLMVQCIWWLNKPLVIVSVYVALLLVLMKALSLSSPMTFSSIAVLNYEWPKQYSPTSSYTWLSTYTNCNDSKKGMSFHQDRNFWCTS